MEEDIKHHIRDHVAVLFSSFAYILAAVMLLDTDKTVVSFLFLVFLTSLFYHSYPEIRYFRIADWMASTFFAMYLISFIYERNLFSHNFAWILIALIFISVFSWFSSLYFSTKENKTIYNVVHTVWHIFSSITVFFIAFIF